MLMSPLPLHKLPLSLVMTLVLQSCLLFSQVMGHRYVMVERVQAAEFTKAFPNFRPSGGAQGSQRAQCSSASALPTAVQALTLGPAPAPALAVAPAGKCTVGSAAGGKSSCVSGAGHTSLGGSNGAEGGTSGGAIVIKMRGLPYSATEAEIAQFFNGIRIAPGGVSIGRDASGRASGEAHVEFLAEADAQAAMLLNRQRIGRQCCYQALPVSILCVRSEAYISDPSHPPALHAQRLFTPSGSSRPGSQIKICRLSLLCPRCSRYIELFRTKQPPNTARRSVSATATEGSSNSDCLRLRGMPFNSTEADVLSFFKG